MPPVKQPTAQQAAAAKQQQQTTKGRFEVQLPAGGKITLNDADEVLLWDEAARRYIQDYGLAKANDLVLLGAILSQSVAMYRAQQALNDPKKASNAIIQIGKCSEHIRELEKSLGIDKKTREQGGQHTTADFVTTLKRAAHAKGIRIADRVKDMEAFFNELKWKIRLLENGDDEDRAQHGLTPQSVLEWASRELGKLEEKEKEWAHTQGKVFVGRL